MFVSNEYYFNLNNAECDFVIVEKGSVVSLIQVYYEMNFDNKEREMKGLNIAMDELNVKDGTIITFNQTDSYIYNCKVIEIIPASSFFMT